MPKQITKLTDEQIAEMPIWADKWIKISLCTDPADRPRAEAAYRACYRAAKLNDNIPIIWVESPIVGAFAASISATALFNLQKKSKSAGSAVGRDGLAVQ